MKPFKLSLPRFLARPSLPRLARPAAVDFHGINDTIQRALAAAGLQPESASAGDVSETILAARVAPAAATSTEAAGRFISGTFTNHAGSRGYKLYIPVVPADAAGARLPLVVMLHGCTQSPDDFAAGTRMNALADVHGFLVLYPAQSANANGSKCWNWFQEADQQRDHGEPAILAGLTRKIVADYHLDADRVFVAGLSAGAAMAVVLGATYPELFAAVGAHSGLPYGSAHDVPSAFAAMKNGQALPGRGPLRAIPVSAASAVAKGVPTIVFHGDRDTTVTAKNSAAIIDQATRARSDAAALRTTLQDGVAAGGRGYRRTVLADANGRPVLEQWLVRGAGHAWSGGSPMGSYTDAAGPDASSEMIRFFQAQSRDSTSPARLLPAPSPQT